MLKHMSGLVALDFRLFGCEMFCALFYNAAISQDRLSCRGRRRLSPDPVIESNKGYDNLMTLVIRTGYSRHLHCRDSNNPRLCIAGPAVSNWNRDDFVTGQVQSIQAASFGNH